jgi:tRNA G18 (ribose-2'-O)-methylase SpoU
VDETPDSASTGLSPCKGEHVSAPVGVEDPSDPRLAEYVDLTDPVMRRRIEAERGFFIAESPLVVRRLLASDRRVRSVLVTPERYDALADALSVRPDVPVYVASDDVLRRVVGFHLHRGVVAAADRWPLPEPSAVLQHSRRVAVLQKVNDHENLGVLFRSAAALGADAVLLDPECSDPLYRRCVRVSIGHVFVLPWTRVAALDEVGAGGFTLYALTPDPAAVPIASIAWPERVALLLGAEGPGLSDAWLARADERVRIPMQPGSDSLNVATAAAIAFYEAFRSRG